MRRLLLTCLAAALMLATGASPAAAAFGLKNLEFEVTGAGGSSAIGAGTHPLEVTTNFEVNTEPNPHPTPEEEFEVPQGALKGLEISTAPGIVGNPTAVPRCPAADFFRQRGGNECPIDSVVGEVEPFIEEPGATFPSKVYSLKPPPGVAAEIGFWTIIVPYTFDLTVNPEPPYNVIARPENIPQVVPFYSSRVSLWGVPASPVHDAARGGSVAGPAKPFITLPTSCSGPLATSFSAESWEGATFAETIRSAQEVTECQSLGFEPTIAAATTTTQAESPSGLDFSLNFEDPGLTAPEGTAGSEVEKAVVTLPQGVTTNPSVANGLGACTLAQYEATVQGHTACPESSRIGTVAVESPLLEREESEGGGSRSFTGRSTSAPSTTTSSTTSSPSTW